MDAISSVDLIIYLVISFVVSIFGGIAGGGGGFITTPLLIFLGLTPAQSVAVGKLAGFSISVTSLIGLRKVKIGSKKELIIIMVIALVVGLAAPFVIKTLDAEIYKKLLGLLLLIMIPVLLLKKIGIKNTYPGKIKKTIGYFLISISMALLAVFSGGLGVLVNIVMMGFLGMTALVASVTKRYSQLILNGSVAIGLLSSGLIYWPVAIGAIITVGLGGYIGARTAVKKGDSFVMGVFIVLMFISATWLLVS